MIYPCKFDENLPSGSRNTVHTSNFYDNKVMPRLTRSKTIYFPSPLVGGHKKGGVG